MRDAYNPSLPADVTAYNNGVTPPALLYHNLHPNETGELVMSHAYEAKMIELGY